MCVLVHQTDLLSSRRFIPEGAKKANPDNVALQFQTPNKGWNMMPVCDIIRFEQTIFHKPDIL